MVQDLFLAYAQDDAPTARSLAGALRRLPVPMGVVLAREGIVAPGESYVGWLQTCLGPGSVFVALISSHSTGDVLMMEALGLARARAHVDRTFRIIPVFLEPTPPPHGLGILEPLHAYGGSDIEGLADRLLHRLAERERPTHPVSQPGRLGRMGIVLGARYELLEELGEGRLTTTYRALDRERNATVAVKLLHPKLAGQPQHVQSFMRAVEATTTLSERGVPRLVARYGAVEDDSRCFLIEELIPGPSLHHAIVRSSIGPRDLVTIVEHVGQTLSAMHEHGQAHHRVTPTNILLDQASLPWLTDLDPVGVCREASPDAMAYCAPEVLFETYQTDARADVFSLAMVVAFGLCESKAPTEALIDRAGFVGKLPCNRRVRELLAQALVSDPNERPSTVAELCVGLRQAWEEGDRLRGTSITSSGEIGPSPAQGGSHRAAIADLDRERIRRRCLSSVFLIPTQPVTVGRYVLGRRLDRGATGQVHEAYDPVLKRDVAIKLVALEGLERLAVDQRRRLLNEAQALAKVSHPNVVHVYEIDPDTDPPYIAMELVKGKNLAQWISEDQPTWVEIMDVFYEAGDGLAAAHDAGIIHRDFKPQNVMLDDSEPPRVRVTDFGLARIQLDEPVVTEIQGREVWAGTPLYMAPEQARNLATTHSDQFAFCVSLYECLFGEAPFRGPTVAEIQARIAVGPPVPKDLRGVPSALLSLLQTGLAADQDQRHASMRALLDALDSALPEYE